MNWFKRAKPKYGNKTIERAGRSFASKLESAVFDILKLREKAGEISEVTQQQTIEFPCGIRWRVDYSFVNNISGQREYCESKGYQTEVYLLKKRMAENCPCVSDFGVIEIWKGSYLKPKLDEVIKNSTHGILSAGKSTNSK